MGKHRLTIKVNDTRPNPTLSNPIDPATGSEYASMTGATATFTMENAETGTVKVSAVTATTTVSGGQLVSLAYPWAAGDTDTVGTYRSAFEVTDANSKKITLPNDPNGHYIEVEILDDLDDT